MQVWSDLGPHIARRAAEPALREGSRFCRFFVGVVGSPVDKASGGPGHPAVALQCALTDA